MEEIEVKIVDIDRAQVEQTLLSLGARRTFNDEMHILLFDTPNHSLREQGITLRVRQEGKKTMLTIKTLLKNSAAKRRNEIEVEVSDFDKTRRLLEALGFVVDKEMRKKRSSYSIEDVHVEFDTYLGEYAFIPEFMEIEAKDEKTIFKYAKLLGFSPEQCKPWSLQDLVEHYKKKK